MSVQNLIKFELAKMDIEVNPNKRSIQSLQENNSRESSRRQSDYRLSLKSMPKTDLELIKISYENINDNGFIRKVYLLFTF